MLEVPDYVRDLFKKIAKSEGFVDYSTETKAGSNHGDNFTSTLASVTIRGNRMANDSSNEDELHLLCKFGPLNAHRRKEFQTPELFGRERYVYEKLLPTFAEFQREKGLSESEMFLAYPKYFAGVSDEEKEHFVIIMEDVRPQGFSMVPKNQPIPLDHARLMVQQLGRYHAISFAIKDQRPDVFEEFTKLKDMFTRFFTVGKMLPTLHASYDLAIEALENEKHKEILESVKNNTIPYLNDCIEDAFGPFGIVGHGDCWTNNLLFQYENETKSVSKICLVDWQITRYCSPALDLLYFIFTATDKDTRDKEYDNLLHLYYTSLAEMVTRLGSDPEKLFTFDNLKDQLKKCGKFPFLLVPILLQIMMADAKDISNLDDLSENVARNEGNVSFVKGYGKENQAVYNKRIREVIGDMVELGLSWK